MGRLRGLAPLLLWSITSLTPPTASAQQRGEDTAATARKADLNLAFELGAGGGPMLLRCTGRCASTRPLGAGPLLAIGMRVSDRSVLQAEIVGAATEQAGSTIWVWAIMPAYKLYISRLLYVSGGAGIGEFGVQDDGEDTSLAWLAGARVGYTLPRHPAATFYLASLAPLNSPRAGNPSTTFSPGRPAYIHAGIELSYTPLP